ncbi:MAG: response regulator [Gemmatimonadaceae bacterium]
MPAHVLIVEDSELVIGALRVLLEASGYHVSSAGNVREAIDAARTGRPDVMLLDLSLPDGDGLEVLHDLQKSSEVPRVSVVMTGRDGAETRQRCERAGCHTVLLKPVSARDLPRMIGEWLGARG